MGEGFGAFRSERERVSLELCATCGRATRLTFHHLIPKKMHRRQYFRKHFSKEKLNLGVRVCRPCHTGIHKAFDEMTLAKNYNTLEKLLAEESLARHFAWVRKQKVANPKLKS
ncbi:MAG: hypothetical protein AAF098_07335 [Pseudomonadota bacterium]